MKLYHCAAYEGGADRRFHVRASDDAQAIASAKAEAQRVGRGAVLVEDADGRKVYDGTVLASAA